MKYAAFLRGINVGGNSKVPMVDLKKLLEGLGFKEVKTLLNSGNVVFEADESKGALVEKIETALEKEFGFKIIVIIRTISEIQKLTDSDPFKQTKVNPSVRLYVTFLLEKELFNVVDLTQKGTADLMKQIDREYGKLSTTRNWNTLLKIVKI